MSLARRAASRLGRNRAFPRRLPPSVGGAKIYASTEGGLKYLKRDMDSLDPPLLRFAEDYVKVSDVVWDIGANLGLFSFAAAGLAGSSGQVLCLEPDMWLVGLLRRSAQANGPEFAAVEVLPAAVSDSVGIATFMVAGSNRATNALEGYGRTRHMGGVRERQHVPTVTLDSLLEYFPPPKVLKIDVEGVEARVLAGGAKLLADARPTICVEVGSEAKIDATNHLLRHDYRLFDLESGEPMEHTVWSTLAIPAERCRDDSPRARARDRDKST